MFKVAFEQSKGASKVVPCAVGHDAEYHVSLSQRLRDVVDDSVAAHGNDTLGS